MASQRSGKGAASKNAAGASARRKTAAKGFTDVERAAMEDRAKELKAEARGRRGKADVETEVLAKIAEMPPPDRTIAERLHQIVKETAPHLSPRLWYGMPAYTKNGKVLCFFQSAHKFKTRYSTFGFTDAASLDDGNMWPVSYALRNLSAAEAGAIRLMLERAVN